MERFKSSWDLICFVLLCTVFLIVGGISGANNLIASEGVRVDLNKVPQEKWKALEGKKIFFGHHSVGYNILDGVEKVESREPVVKLNIVRLGKPADLQMNGKGILGHTEVGENFNPNSKIADFTRWIENGIGNNADIAFMKFCFVDIGTRTDLPVLFNYYKDTLDKLKQEYPDTTFVHVTVPLLAEKTGLSKWKHKLKGIIKKVTGKNEFYDNVSKFDFNELLRKEYGDREPLFDLAAIESTFPDGQRSIISVGNKSIESMVPEYDEDGGGHLTPLGREIVAENLLLFLVNLNE